MQHLGQGGVGHGDARAWLADGRTLRVLGATHEGVCVDFAGAKVPRPGQTVDLSLGDASELVGPLRLRVASVSRRQEEVRVVLSFGSMSADRRRHLAAMLLRWPSGIRHGPPAVESLGGHRIIGRAQLSAVLSLMAAEQAGALGHAPDDESDTVRLRAVQFDSSDAWEMHWLVDGPAPPVPFVIEVGVAEFHYILLTTAARMEGGQLVTGMPDEILRAPIAARWLPAVADPDRWTVTLETGAPCRLRRATTTHLAFAMAPESFVPGERVSVVVDDGGGRGVTGVVELESLFPSPERDEILCRARFEPAGASERAHWTVMRERLCHPSTRRAGIWAASLWELYDRSGYFQLSGKTSAHFTPLRQAFALTTRRLDTAPEIGCQVVWPSRERVEAAVSVLFVYGGTAMVYQVARRRDDAPAVPARRMLRDVNVHAFEQLRRDPDFEWTLVYVQEGGARWSHLAYQTFSEFHLPTGLTTVVRFRAMESSRASLRAHDPLASVGEATVEETALFLAALPSLRAMPYLEALDLVPERFDLAQVRGRWAKAGFLRERVLLVARGPSGPVAAAVVEAAQDALHLFGLLDCVRLYPLRPGGKKTYPQLLEASRRWFRARGKSRFVCFFEAESVEEANQPGLTDLGAANLMAFPRLLMPDFIEHLWSITAPRPRTH